MAAPVVTYRLGPVSINRDEASYVGCLLISYLFSFFYYHHLLNSKREWVKHLYMVGVSTLFLLLNFNAFSLFQFVLPIGFTYSFALSYRRAPWMPLVNFVVTMGMLSFAHLYRQFYLVQDTDVYVMDISGPLMMLIIKLTSFAFDMRDALVWSQRRTPTPVPKAIRGPQEPKEVPGSDRQTKSPLVDAATRYTTLRRYPSLLEFLGYTLLFPGVLTGPSMPFYEYRTFINGSYFAGVDLTKEALPGRKRRAFYLFSVAIFFMFIYVFLSASMHHSRIITDEFIAKPIWYRLLYLHGANVVSRSKYYFAWLIAEGSYVIIGLGFRLSSSRKPLWDRLENVNPFRIEFVSDFKLLIGQWNVATNQWLHSYVYRRIQHYYERTGSGARASIVTYIVSAFWHGFYPGYYLTFITAALQTIVSRLIFKTVNWPWGSTSRRIAIYIPLHIMVDYIATPFMLLDLDKSLRYYRSFYYFGHIVIFVLLFIFAFIVPLINRGRTLIKREKKN